MNAILQFFENFWNLTAEMAPYLLLGFAFAGLLTALIKKESVRRWLGGSNTWATVKATFAGVPMPLCSCSVIPVAATLRQHGASRGATTAFLSSTPQTGVDSILATWALLGPLFTAVRVGVAFVSGIVAGTFVNLFGEKDAEGTPGSEPPTKTTANCCEEEASGDDCCASGSAEASCCDHEAAHTAPRSRWREGFVFGAYRLPGEIGRSLLLGLFLAALITTVLPPDILGEHLGRGWLSYLAVTLVAVPLYVCATGSIPFAFALLAAGLSPGAALVFLIAGPATNIVTLSTMLQMVGKRSTVIYLTSLLVIAWLAGAGLDAFSGTITRATAAHAHLPEPSLFQHLCGFALATILIIGLLPSQLWSSEGKAGKSASCCQ